MGATPRMIRADGMDWPLQTYLDARDFRSVDPFDPPSVDGDIRCDLVTTDGVLRCGRFACDVTWHDTLAWRPVSATLCEHCGDPCEDPLSTECDGCRDWSWA